MMLLMALCACSPGESRIRNDRLKDTRPPTAEPERPLRVHSVELEGRAEPEGGPRDWVGCSGGRLDWEGGRVAACRLQERAWVDERDEVAVVVMADHAFLARARVGDHEVEAPFVDGRARLSLRLMSAYAKVLASKVSEATPLEVVLEVEHGAGVATGRLTLFTPRVLRLLEGAQGVGLVLGSDKAGAAVERRGAIFVGPEMARLPPNPEVPVGELARVVLDIGVPQLVMACPLPSGQTPAAIRAGRRIRPVILRVIDLERGDLIGERVLGGEAPPCGEAAIEVGPDQVANAVEVMVAGGAPREAPYAGVAVKDPMPLVRLTAFLGLAHKMTAEAVAKVLPVSESVGVLFENEGLVEVRVSGKAGVDILKTKNLEDPLFRLVDAPVETALAELGRPVVSGRGFLTWTVDQGPLTIYAELACDTLCRELRVGYLEGKDPHDGGDVPGAAANPHSHRHPNDDGHGHGHDDHEHVHPDTRP